MSEYQEAQRLLVDKLKEHGIYYRYNDRLPLFVLRTALIPLVSDKDKLKEVYTYMDDLMQLRVNGLEPAHEHDEYLYV
jgi:hypothetical protein